MEKKELEDPTAQTPSNNNKKKARDVEMQPISDKDGQSNPTPANKVTSAAIGGDEGNVNVSKIVSFLCSISNQHM